MASGQISQPKKVLFPDDVFIKYLAGGPNHSLAIDSENNLWGFGKIFNYKGMVSSKIPCLMDTISDVRAISNGGQAGFIIKTIHNVIVVTNCNKNERIEYLGPINTELQDYKIWDEKYNDIIDDNYFYFSKQKSARFIPK